MANGSDVKSFLIGAAIGTGLGILYAPRKGSKTREQIRYKAAGTTNDVKDWVNQKREDIALSAEEKKEDFEKKLEMTLSSMSYKAEDVITSLESKLEELKKKNKKLQKK